METQATYQSVAEFLRLKSKEICRDNDCDIEGIENGAADHNCGSYAYFDYVGGLYRLQTICLSDYCQRSYDSYVCLPFDGDADDLLQELDYNLLD